MMRFVTWDIEIARSIPLTCPKCKGQEINEGIAYNSETSRLVLHVGCHGCGFSGGQRDFIQPDWPSIPDLGISCAACAWRDKDGKVQFAEWADYPQMGDRDLYNMLAYLQASVAQDNTRLVTWNGLGFDWRVLHRELGGTGGSCAKLAMGHVDGLFQIVCAKGWPLGLDAACRGMGVAGKLKEVVLNNGMTITGMYGGMAPALWQSGDTDAVTTYLRQDVQSLLELVEAWERVGYLTWRSSSGKTHIIADKPMPVSKCLTYYGELDTSWMSNPKTRESYYDWTKETTND
jgi:hypothetical protein